MGVRSRQVTAIGRSPRCSTRSASPCLAPTIALDAKAVLVDHHWQPGMLTPTARWLWRRAGLRDDDRARTASR